MLPPGTPLSEIMLPREYGMSRTPIREGLARLWQKRYLERVVGHGYLGARVTAHSIHDTYKPSDAPSEYRDVEAANVRFHMAIAASARNELALELIERCLAQIDRFMSLGVRQPAHEDALLRGQLSTIGIA
jgi:DNA-binding GntR family transcriptional regulator